MYKNKKFFLSFIILFNLFILNNKIQIITKQRKDNIFFDEKFPNISEAFNNAKNFLDKCLKDKLNNNQTIFKSENPEVSVIIPLHNCEKSISRAIKSIQYQNILDLEIILVNDFSEDKTLSIITMIQNTDHRIKIINNKKNMGTLYSRSIGGLSSKGNYIFHLDSDDMFLDEDIFSTMINIINKGKFDIIAFKAINSYGKNILTNKIKINRLIEQFSNKVLFQPELGSYPLKKGKKFGSFKIKGNYLWNKCIRAKVYKTALKKIGKERYSRFMIYEEDRVVIYVLLNIALSMKFIGKFGILKIVTPNSMTRIKHYMETKTFFICKLYYTDIVIDFAKKSLENGRLLVYLIIFLLKKKKIKQISKLNEYNKNLLISCLYRILNNEYVSDADKNEIKKRASKIYFLSQEINKD